jgi:hypothetical protein
MRSTTRAQGLLALFTSADRAEGIVGDLTEGRDVHGSAWFWRQVLATMVALWGSTFTSAPWATLGLAAAGCFLFASSALSGIAAVAFFPQHIGSAVSWIKLSSIWWSGALLTGASLAGIGQARGMVACVALAILSEGLVTALGVTILQRDILRTSSVVFFSIAALAPLALLTGGAVVRFRPVMHGDHIPEHP